MGSELDLASPYCTDVTELVQEVEVESVEVCRDSQSEFSGSKVEFGES